eukprot:CAMPEP_0205810828 /NCGR_PEP_ID=MMETSP0205-20121125/14986_1 /ASSEMBLY_ACC=CAM_ASM_000278 /TAXON_ID=36767 /ORGANISM="Euplotes focardii, Strain TN1" /LENGTH=168 /DNA_ID=CAMNT_0053089305 /DNA_START=215 /DNA_END=718 /DNA_ORIENTATION=+
MRKEQVILEERSRVSEEDDKTQEFYNDISEDNISKRIKTPIQVPSKESGFKKSEKAKILEEKVKPREEKNKRLVEKTKPLIEKTKPLVEKSKPLEEADDVSNNILNMIPDVSEEDKKQIASLRKESQPRKEERFELFNKAGEISTKPVGGSKFPLDPKKVSVTTNQAT